MGAPAGYDAWDWSGGPDAGLEGCSAAPIPPGVDGVCGVDCGIAACGPLDGGRGPCWDGGRLPGLTCPIALLGCT